MQLYYFLHYLLNTFQMWSDLRILVVGFVDKKYSDVFSTLNALAGRQAFNRDRWTEKQEACVEVEGGRRLWLTYMPDTLFRDMGDAYREGRTTELDNYHCVVIAMEFNESNLNLWHNIVVSETLSQKFGESFLKKHCVLIVTGGDGFAKARSEGRETRTFEGWCKGFAIRDGDNCFAVFKGVQERWLLFHNNASPDELKQQRQQLVDIVDTQILVGSQYTNMKFKEVEIIAAKLEKQNLDLKGELEKKAKELIETRASDVQKSEQQFSHLREKTTERSQVLEQEVEKLKQQLEEKTRSIVERQESDSCKMMERLQELEQRLKEKTGSVVERQVSDSCKMMERSQVLEQEVEQLKQQLEDKTSSVVERQESDSCKMMEMEQRQSMDSMRAKERSQEQEQQILELNQQLEQVNEKSTVESTRATERLETVEQKLTSQIEEIKGELQRARERSLWNRVVSLPQSLPLQTSPRLGLALLVLLVLLSLIIPLLRPAPTNRPREITMLDEGLDLRRYVNSKFEETTKRLREIERQITELKIDVCDKTEASNEKDSERADKRIQQIEEQFAELKEQVMIDSTVQVEEIQRMVEEKYSEKGSHLMEMIRSLPVSLPLLIGLTVTILSVSTVPLPVPFPALLAALFVSLLILQLLLLVLLLGA